MTTVRNLASRRAGGDRPRTEGMERPVTVRLDELRLSLMTGLAIIDETTVAEQIRQACETYIQVRVSDPLLPEKVETAVARFRSSVAPVLDNPIMQRESSLEPPAPPGRDLATEKPVTLRLAGSSVEYFTSLAILDGHTVADELRAAVDLYVAQRRHDPELENRIQETRQDHNNLLSRLSVTA